MSEKVAGFVGIRSFDSFIIEYALTVNRTMNMMQYGHTVSANNAGRESDLVLRLFNKGNLPEDLKGAEWRAFAVDKVLADYASRPGGGGLRVR